LVKAENGRVYLSLAALHARHEVPVSRTTFRHWQSQDRRLLDAAAAKIQQAGASLWVFASDARHFWQFCSAADRAALESLTAEESAALLGWSEEDCRF
jgi:hypothetical protein